MRVIHLTIGLLLMTSAFAFATPVAAHLECNPYADGDSDGDGEAADDNDCDTNPSSNNADHHHPDCEEGQPAAGGEDDQATSGSGGLQAGPVFVCEGEHWDGDDHANPSNGANGQDTDGDQVGVAVNDPADTGHFDAVTTALPLVGHRTSADTDRGAVYTHTGIANVGETAVAYDSDDGKQRVAWYGEDGTPLNVLAQAVSLADITRGDPGENDCTFQTYEEERHAPGGCTRDNTAITVEITP